MNGGPPRTGFFREGFLVSARTRFQHARHPCRRQARPGDRRAGNADLPDHLLRLQRCRSCRLAVRPEGLRQHLHPHHEPDAGGARGARRRARRRHGGPCHGLRPCGAGAGLPHHHAARATISSRPASSTAARSTSSATPSRISAGRCAGPTPHDPASFESQIDDKTRGIFIESLANPGGNFVDIEEIGDVARSARPAADRRQHAGHPLSHAADRARRRHRRAFADQIHRRPRQFDGRRHRRRRHLRLVEIRQLSDAVGAAARNMAAWSCTRLSAISPSPSLPRARPARSRPGDLALQRLPDPDRHRDAAAAHAAPLRQCAGRRRMAVEA